MAKKLCIIVVGPTAGGKSELAVLIAKKYNGEIISADSRQIYSGMDIGTGKVEGSWKQMSPKAKPIFIYKTIPHYLIDEISPRLQYSAARFQRNANKHIKDIHSRGKIPILCGGTAQWIDAAVYNQTLPNVVPNPKLRKKLEVKSSANLFAQLQKLDPTRAKTIDKQNPRRLIRALEIVITSGKPVPALSQMTPYNLLWVGLNPNQAVLHQNITTRLDARIKAGMITETASLHDAEKVSWKKLESFGLEYKFCALYLQGKLNKTEMTALLATAIKQYAKRQMTWWKRNKNINWFAEKREALNWLQVFLRNEENN